jgi:hypothetical protein
LASNVIGFTRASRQQRAVWAPIGRSSDDLRVLTLIALTAALGLGLATVADAQRGSESGSLIVIATGNTRDYKLTSKAAGVMFDFDGDGVKEQISWTEPDSDLAFLALDSNNNGRIDNGTELFGNHTTPVGGSGFAALLRLESATPDGKLNRDDPIFPQLLLWRDKNHNGVSEPEELSPAYDTIEAIGLGWTPSHAFVDENGNQFRFEGWARKVVPGKSGLHKATDDEDYYASKREFRIYEVLVVK